MNEPRSAGEMGDEFPYKLGTVCYIEVANDGSVSCGNERTAYERAKTGQSRLYAVWPGEWSSHLFVIDDLDHYARAFGIIHDVKRTGLADHEHEVRREVSRYEENPHGAYISIDVWLDCGCAIRDLRTFATQMREQRGWDVAVTSGWGSGGGSYSLRVRRKSLDSKA